MRPIKPELLREALTKVPEVTLVFWIIKIAATTLGGRHPGRSRATSAG